MEIKEITVFSPKRDLINDCLDIRVVLEDQSYSSDLTCIIEVTTVQFLPTLMGEKKFLAPDYPMIIVSKLTDDIVYEAIQAFVDEQEDAYWLKLYYITCLLDIDDINQILINKGQLKQGPKTDLENKPSEGQT